MLISLSVKDVVLIDNLDLSFSSGFSALTGETGAGKSILMDALALVLGKRSENRLIRKGQDFASVTAEFNVGNDHKVIEYVRMSGLNAENEFILRRQIGANGRSQSFLNDQPISLNFMKEIGFMLVEIHGQHDKSGLLDSSTHLDVLDSWAGIKDSVSEIRLSSNNLKKISKELESSIVNLERMRNEKANIEQNLAEIDNLNLAEGEEDRLLEKRNFLSSMEKISSSINQVNNNLLGSDEYGSVKDRIESAKKTLMSIYKLAGERLNNLKNALDRASIEMSEVEVELKNSNSMLSYDSNDLEKVESRIYELRKIYRKHFLNNHDDLKDFKQKLKKKLKSIEENSNLIEELSHTKEQFEKDYITKAKNISKMRNKAALELSNAINKELPYLKLSDATFRVNIELIDENIYGTKGFDKVLFEIEANKGNGFGPISKIASGGELSRIMLALKASLLKSNDTSKNKRTMIFDEVDSGVGGAVAHAVGQRLLKIGNNQQVLAVTHQPQVAARANHHLKVDKINEKSFIKTIVKPLDDNERREELARMLSGAKITDAARKAAISLVDQV